MNITSYNVTDVSYHYIGLRAVAKSPPKTTKKDQHDAISRAILKHVSDRSLRLLLPEPKGSFETIGEKVCQELQHFKLIGFDKNLDPYSVTQSGSYILNLLENGKHTQLRKEMVKLHLSIYDNFRIILYELIDLSNIILPIIESKKTSLENYFETILLSLKDNYLIDDSDIRSKLIDISPKKAEDIIRQAILNVVFKKENFSVPLFRALCDRMNSLRLLNSMRITITENTFLKIYSPCLLEPPKSDWYEMIEIALDDDDKASFFYCAPDMSVRKNQDILLSTIISSFSKLKEKSGYYDIPDLRDIVCESLRIPEFSFDEALNAILDRDKGPLTVGLQYEGISNRRKPLLRTRGTTQVYNLIRSN